MILTFDNSAGLSLVEKFHTGLASVGLQKSRLNSRPSTDSGMLCFLTVLSERYGHLRVGESVKSDQREAVRRSLIEFRRTRPDIHNLLPRKLGYRVYSELFSTFKNNLILPDTIFSSVSANKPSFRCKGNRLLAPWLNDATPDSIEELQIVNALANLYRHYCQMMLRHNRIDFDDQKLLPYLGLANNESLAKKRCQTSFGASSLMNFRTSTDSTSSSFASICDELIVVGMMTRLTHSVVAAPTILRFLITSCPVKMHVLNVNYRCPKNIVKMSNQLIQHNSDRIPKSPTAASNKDADVKLWHCLNKRQ